jgi:flagellar motility protein MotE (MotC chaperone)
LEERLNILVPNFELEKEWNELKELGDKYRALEAKFKEQSKMWEKLKEMPPPKPLY